MAVRDASLEPDRPSGVSLWLVSAAWGRYPTTRVALSQRRHLCDQLANLGIDAHGVIVADDDNLTIADELGFHTVEQDNRDVGDKFNTGFAYALEHGADYIGYLGSDNWAHIDFFSRLPGPREVLTGKLLQAVNVAEQRMRLCAIDTVYGVIPWTIPTSMLERCNGRPIEPGLTRGFDGSMIRGLTRSLGTVPTFTHHDPHPYCRVDFKTDANITAWDILVGKKGVGEDDDPWQALAEFYPATLVEQARELLT